MPEPVVPAATPAARPRPRWHRSLYWRIAIALIALVTLMLSAEGALFLYLSDRTAGAMPGRNPQDMVRLVGSDVATALGTNAALDVDKYLHDQYGHFFQTILVTIDGRVFANHDDVPAEDLRSAQLLFFRPGRRSRGGPAFPGSGPDVRGGAPGGPRFGDGRPPRRSPPFRGEWTTIVVDGTPRGIVALMAGDPPFSRIVRLVGPTMGLVAGGVLIAGGSLIALLVFGPARKRLLQVQDATERLGAGDLLARAPEHGGDEVAVVAHSFNRMADELTRRAQALESSDKARRQLLADVSHELMTPLTAMRGYIETLGMPGLSLDPVTRERYMHIVTEETHRLEHIIGDLLDLARLEGGGLTLRRECVPVEMLFDRVAERHERELSARGIHLERTLEPGADEVMGDPGRLEQALQNLAANALRFTPDGGRVSLSASFVRNLEPLTRNIGNTEPGMGNSVQITVRDSGPGIPPDHLPLIFDRFYKVDASRKAAGGSGIGLSIVKAIIERHGGTIGARNEGGAVFEIRIPRG